MLQSNYRRRVFARRSRAGVEPESSCALAADSRSAFEPTTRAACHGAAPFASNKSLPCVHAKSVPAFDRGRRPGRRVQGAGHAFGPCSLTYRGAKRGKGRRGFPWSCVCVGARTSRIGDHHWSRRSYVCTACPALLEPRTLMLVMTNHLSQARTFRALCVRVVMRALRVRCCPRLPMIQRYDHTARAQCSLLHRALARRPRASTSTPLGDRFFVTIPFTDGIR